MINDELQIIMTNKEFSNIALSFQHTEENPHFDRRAFKVTGKRIFATMLEKDNTVNIVLTYEEQQEFCKEDTKHVYPVPNKWGEKGWTTFELKNVENEIIHAALTVAYEAVIKPKK